MFVHRKRSRFRYGDHSTARKRTFAHGEADLVYVAGFGHADRRGYFGRAAGAPVCDLRSGARRHDGRSCCRQGDRAPVRAPRRNLCADGGSARLRAAAAGKNGVGRLVGCGDPRCCRRKDTGYILRKRDRAERAHGEQCGGVAGNFAACKNTAVRADFCKSRRYRYAVRAPQQRGGIRAGALCDRCGASCVDASVGRGGRTDRDGGSRL